MEKLLWIDMEMTGLDVSKEVPIEIAAIVTNLQLEEVATYHSIIKQPNEFLERMDDWNKSHHGASGLTVQVPNGRDPKLVEEDLLKILEIYFPNERAVLAGNSIGQDRLFLNHYFQSFAGKLHYRMVDVTSWKIMMNECFQVRYSKQNTHRATDDIRESISEMKHYLSFVSAKK